MELKRRNTGRWAAHKGMSEAEIIEDFPELDSADIRACLAFAADREHTLYALTV